MLQCVNQNMKIEDATTAKQIAETYNSKEIIKNQNKDKKSMVDYDLTTAWRLERRARKPGENKGGRY